MAKRGFKHADKFEKSKNGYYPTLSSGPMDVLASIIKPCKFVEPCAGLLDMVRGLEKHGWRCTGAFDIERYVDKAEERGVPLDRLQIADTSDPAWRIPDGTDMVVTNPPWGREFIEKALRVWIPQAPVALLLPCRFEHNKWFAPWLRDHGRYVIPVGRVRFVEGTSTGGIFDSTWFVFGPAVTDQPITFIPREPYKKDANIRVLERVDDGADGQDNDEGPGVGRGDVLRPEGIQPSEDADAGVSERPEDGGNRMGGEASSSGNAEDPQPAEIHADEAD